MTHLGLFEGIGGFSLAARWMGWETVAWCEINPFCQKVLKYHFPHADCLTDIKETDFKKYANRIDIITGGFPCQPYSTAGTRKGKEDERHLWPEMLRAVREVSPRWVVGENVRGLTNWNGGLVFDEVQADLEAQGYEVLPFLLPACSKDAPHQRDRIWFIAHSKDALHKRNEREFSTPHGGPEQYNLSTFRKPGDRLRNERIITNTASERGVQSNKKPEPNELFNGEIPGWGRFPTQSPLCGRGDGLPAELDGITFSKWRRSSIEAYGNAVVPQIPYEIFKAIEAYEKS